MFLKCPGQLPHHASDKKYVNQEILCGRMIHIGKLPEQLSPGPRVLFIGYRLKKLLSSVFACNFS
jgi:hypothetical protein